MRLLLRVIAIAALAVRSTPYYVPNCLAFLEACMDSPDDLDHCQHIFINCSNCTSIEAGCRFNAGQDLQMHQSCTIDAQLCYHRSMTTSLLPWSTNNCEDAWMTCRLGVATEHCDDFFDSCTACAQLELQCDKAAGANETACATSSQQCFANAVTQNGTLS